MFKQKSKTLTLVKRVSLTTIIVVVAVSIFIGLKKGGQATAATSSTINFQARLLTAAGNVVPDGNYNVEFKLYDVSSGGSALWTETRTSGDRVRVVNGYLTVNLGSVTAFGAINWDQELWLTMNVGGTLGSPSWDGEMTPRLKLTAVPHAFTAGKLVGGSGSNTTTLDTGTPSGNNTISLPAESGTLCIQNSANCGFALTGSGSFIQNGTAVQANANFYIQSAANNAVGGIIRGATGQTSSLFQLLDGSSGLTVAQFTNNGYLHLGSDSISRTGQIVFHDGTLSNSNTITLIAPANVASSSKTITLPDETGTICIQNSTNCGFAAGSGDGDYIQNQSAAAQTANYFIRSAATGTAGAIIQGANGQTADLLQLQSWNGTTATTVFSVNNSGVVHVAGGQTRDITTADAATSTALVLQPGVSSAVTTTGAALTLRGGEVSGTTTVTGGAVTIQGGNATGGSGTRNGGAVNISGGTGASSNGAVNIGTLVNGTSTIQIGHTALSTGTQTINIGNSNTAGGTTNIVIGAAGTSSTGGTTTIQADQAVTITGRAASTWSTSSGLLTVRGAGGITLSSADSTTAATGAVTLQSGNASSGANLNAGTVTIDTGTQTGTGTAIMNIGTTNARAITMGSTGTNTSVIIQGGNGINIGTGGVANTVQIGNTSGGVTQSINIGTNATSGATNNVTIGTTSTSNSVVNINGGTGSNNFITLQSNNAATGTLVKSVTNSAVAFQVRTSTDGIVLGVDTANGGGRVGIGTGTPGYKLDVAGDANLSSGSVYRINGTQICSETGCLVSGGAGSFIQNGTTVQTSANFNIRSAAIGSVGGVIQGANGQTADIFQVQTWNGTSTTTVASVSNAGLLTANAGFTGVGTVQINASGNGATTIGNTGGTATTTIQGGNGSSAIALSTGTNGSIGLTTAGTGDINLTSTDTIIAKATTNFQVQNSSNTPLLYVDTANGNVGIGAAAPTRTLDIAVNNAAVDAPALRLAQAGSGDTSIELKDANGKSFFVGMDASDGGAFKIASSTSASTPITEGYTNTSGSTIGFTDNKIWATKYTIGATGGTVTSLSIYVPDVDNTTPGGQVALYADNGGAPGALIASSGTQSLVDNSWNTFPLSASVNASTTYWLARNVQGVTEGRMSSSGGAGWREFESVPFGTWPNLTGVPADSTQAAGFTPLYLSIIPAGSVDSFNGVSLLRMTDSGAVTFQNSADSTNAFQIQNASGSAIMNVNTSANLVSINQTSSGDLALDVKGGMQQSGMTTPDSGSSGGQWTKLGTCTLTQQFQHCFTVLQIVGGYDGGAGSNTQATVTARVKQQAALGGAPLVNVTVNDTAEVITKDDLVVVITQNNGSATVAELWGRISINFEKWHYAPIINTDSYNNQWAWTPNTAFQAALPAGTQTAARYGNSYANTLTVRSSSNAASVFQVQNASGTSALRVDTDTLRVGIGGNFTPQQALDVVGNIQVRDATTATKSYRLRTSGSALDFEAGGTDIIYSAWTGADFTGTQRNYLRLQSGAHIAQAIGSWQFKTSSNGTTRHTLDGTAGANVAFNQNGEATNVSIQGDTDANLFVAQGSTDRVGIGTAAPNRKLDVAGDAAFTVNNTSTSSQIVKIEQTGTGDAGIELKSIVNSFYVGIDTSDSARFKIGSSSASGGTGTFGTQSIGGSTDSGDIDFQNATKYSAPATGTVTSISVYINGGSSANQFSVALYGDTGGSPSRPGTLIASSANTNITPNAWNTVAVSGAITSGTTYWLAFNTNDSGANMRYTTGAANTSCFVSRTFSQGWLNPFSGGGSCTLGTQTFSIYATYTLGSGVDNLSTGLFSMGSTGDALFKNSTNSTAAFQLQRSNADVMFLADTSGNRIIVGNATASSGSDTTLFVVDTATTANRPTGQVGAMYYDSTIGRIQCYESDGWGSCGSAPDNIIILTPEFAGATLNGTGIGTMTSDFCAQQASVLNVNTTLCPTGVAPNFYKWTSPQGSQQTYSIYVSYKLPTTFSNFADNNTIQLTGRTDNTSNGFVTYELFKSTGSAITACGTETTVTTSVNTWQTVSHNGNENSTCAFAGGNTMIVKINVKSQSNANVYVGELTFTYTNN